MPLTATCTFSHAQSKELSKKHESRGLFKNTIAESQSGQLVLLTNKRSDDSFETPFVLLLFWV